MTLSESEQEARELYHLYKTTANQYTFIATVISTKPYNSEEAEMMWCCFDAVHDLNEVKPHPNE